MSVEIVAEIGASHGQDLAKAKRLCVMAMEAGADAVKLQTYTADSISFRGAGLCPSGPWQGRPLYDLYEEAHMPRDMQHELIDFLKLQRIPWFSTPFSPEDVTWLADRGCPRYKVSSFDVRNDPLLAAIKANCVNGKVVASDGMDRLRAMSAAGAFGVVLRCVSEYPAYAEMYGLRHPPRDPWGISDHTTGSTLGCIAIAKGAVMIERHIKEDGDDATPDAAFATPVSQFQTCVRAWKEAEAIARSNIEHVPLLRQIMPRPQADGQWRRCVKEGVDAKVQ